MTLRSCPHEKEVLALIGLGQWPQASTAQLRAHVAGCSACSDQALVTQTFLAARSRAVAAVKLPPPGALWWRAQLRRRNDAVERVARPIVGAQIFALSVNLLLILGLVVSQARHGLKWLSWFSEIPQAGSLRLEALWPSAAFSSISTFALLIPILATLALIGGIAVYFATEKQ